MKRTSITSLVLLCFVAGYGVGHAFSPTTPNLSKLEVEQILEKLNSKLDRFVLAINSNSEKNFVNAEKNTTWQPELAKETIEESVQTYCQGTVLSSNEKNSGPKDQPRLDDLDTANYNEAYSKADSLAVSMIEKGAISLADYDTFEAVASELPHPLKVKIAGKLVNAINRDELAITDDVFRKLIQ